MGLLGSIIGAVINSCKSSSDMSDSELTRELKKDMRSGESIAERASKIREADARGLAWKDSELNYKKKDK